MSRSRAAWSAANPGNRAAREELLEALLSIAGPQLEGDVLDCGCGTGWLLEALVEAGVPPHQLYGVDADPARVAAARSRVPGAVVQCADGRDLPFPDGRFDIVTHIVSLSSMGSGDSVGAVLRESHRVLVPNGIMVVYEPRWPNPFNRATRKIDRAELAAAGLPVRLDRTLTLLPPLGRRLGPFTSALHPRLSRIPFLRSHALLVHRVPRR